jgi:aspartate aminotransferase-like enzyme
VDVAKLQKLVKDQGFLIDGGYGKIKGTTFRISNMGDETEATMNQLYAALDKAMAQDEHGFGKFLPQPHHLNLNRPCPTIINWFD